MVMISLLSSSGFWVPTAAMAVPFIMIATAAEAMGTMIARAMPVRLVSPGSNTRTPLAYLCELKGLKYYSLAWVELGEPLDPVQPEVMHKHDKALDDNHEKSPHGQDG